MRFSKGDTIGLYTVRFPHKQGSYAETYRVKDDQGKTRFLKIVDYSKLRPDQLDDSGRVIEIETVKRFNHHNLCTYIDSGTYMQTGRQYAYFVTEFISGETLAAKIARNEGMSVYEIKEIAKSVLSALSYVHSLQPVPIIHNEVTAQNVLLNLAGGLGDLKLIDFGHARSLDMSPAKPDLKELNVFYMSPERLNGVSTIQSDLFSVGVLVYQLLYGRLPWFIDLSGLSDREIVDEVLAERDKELVQPDISKFELDDQLRNTIAKALSYDPDDRFQTAEEFINAIDGKVMIERQSTKRKILSGGNQKATESYKPVKKHGEGFKAVAGMEDLKQRLRDEVIEPLHNPEEYKRYGVSIPNGMLLYGPPGCGKTFFAKHFAEETGLNFMFFTGGTLKSKWVNATQENIAKMFKDAEENAPTIIFIEEIDELVPNRDADIHEMARSAVNEMLAQMDRTGEKGVFVIGACNYPNKIDPAILRAGRLENKYYIGPPDAGTRKALFKLYLQKRPYDFGLDYDLLADLTKNYVSADISKIVNDASRRALKQHSKITMEILTETTKATRPSLSPNELAKYDKIKAIMEGKASVENRPHIGFN